LEGRHVKRKECWKEDTFGILEGRRMGRKGYCNIGKKEKETPLVAASERAEWEATRPKYPT
jgi:hypothetical protein